MVWAEPGTALFGRGKSLMEQRGSTDPAGALEILEAVAPIAPKGEDLNAVRRTLLEKLVATQPNEPEVVSRLAAVFEVQGEIERAVALLQPLRARLGTTEGTRILGLAYARRGQVESALALLRPHIRARLESFRVAESDWKSAMRTSSRRVVDRLIANPLRFDSGWSESEKNERMLKHMDNLRNADPEFEQVQQRWRSERALVPVALELGTMLLTHAQSLPDRKSRENELDEAEKLFMDVAGLSGAGDADQSRLRLAEVHYWRNKPHDGQALIDQVLEGGTRMDRLFSRPMPPVGSPCRLNCLERRRAAAHSPVVLGRPEPTARGTGTRSGTWRPGHRSAGPAPVRDPHTV
jgi:tetratricopeptide (TPR) repeat protein